MESHIRYEPIQAKTMLTAVKAPSMPFDWSLNPYRGCQHGCSFCYARSTHSFLGLTADDTFQRHILFKDNAPEALEEQLRKWSRSKQGTNRQVAIGTATDPYQPIEAKAQLTRRCLEILAHYHVPVSITTRSPLILRDIDLLKRMNITSINLSVNTLQKSVWRQFEPFTPSPAKRLETVQALVSHGMNAGIFLAPILPQVTDDKEHLRELVKAAHHAGAQFVMSSFLRLSTMEVKSWFFQTIKLHYPQLLAAYAKLYSSSAYLPKEYRSTLSAYLEQLLQEYRIPGYEPFLQKSDQQQADAAAKEEQPEQLSFSFSFT